MDRIAGSGDGRFFQPLSVIQLRSRIAYGYTTDDRNASDPTRAQACWILLVSRTQAMSFVQLEMRTVLHLHKYYATRPLTRVARIITPVL